MTELPADSALSASSPRRHATLDRFARAVRDLALIVAGVLLALAADSWWDDRRDRHAESVLLGAMAAELREDLVQLAASVETQRSAASATVFLQQRLLSADPFTSDLDTVFGKVYGRGGVAIPAAGAYEGLKSRGLEIVANDSLRLQIIHVYENVLPEVRLANDIDTNVNFEVLRPYFLARFRGVRPGISAMPLDYAGLTRDPYFENLLGYRLYILDRSLLPRYENALREVKELLDMLEDTLEP